MEVHLTDMINNDSFGMISTYNYPGEMSTMAAWLTMVNNGHIMVEPWLTMVNFAVNHALTMINNRTFL